MRSRSLSESCQDFVHFNSQGFHIFKEFSSKTEMDNLLGAVTTSSFDPKWVEIKNWSGDESATAKRWMAAAPECAQRYFHDKIVPFLKSTMFYSKNHDISLGRGVAVLRYVFVVCLHVLF